MFKLPEGRLWGINFKIQSAIAWITRINQEWFFNSWYLNYKVSNYKPHFVALGTYECPATKDYCREGVEPKTPAILFAIDVSYPMMKEGIVQMICSNMKEMLKNLPRDMNCDKVSLFLKE